MAAEDLRKVYDLLWGLAPRQGAVSLAAIVRVMERETARYGEPMELDPAQSAVLREAIAQLDV